MAVAIWRAPEAVRRVIWAAAGYEPNAQQLPIHLDLHRCKNVSGGERSGKSYVTAAELLVWACLCSEPIWIVGPTYDLARPEFVHLLPMAQACDLVLPGSVSMPRSGPCSFKTRLGGEILTKTSQDPEALAGVAPAGVAMVEAAQHTYEAFLRLRGRVAEKRGPLFMSGTFEGSLGWHPALWQEWQGDNRDDGRSFSLPTWSNTAIFPGGRDDPEIRALEARFPADLFMERFGGIPCQPQTLVFKEFSYLLHVRRMSFAPEGGVREEEDGGFVLPQGEPVQVWIDPGYAGAYAVSAVVIIDGNVYNFDEVYARGRTAQEIIAECKERPWWARCKSGVIDLAGGQHQGMESHIEIWRKMAGIQLHAQRVPVPDGILRHRTFLKDPETGKPRLFHDPKCKGAIAEYGLYKYQEVKDNRPERELPVDRDNHCMKELAYGLVANFGFVAPLVLPEVSLRVRAQ
jgi:hypothetical protein